MSVTVEFSPVPPSPDPLTYATIIQGHGVFGSQSDIPVVAVEDDGSAYALTPIAGSPGFNATLITDPSVYDGMFFRQIHGSVTVTHTFDS